MRRYEFVEGDSKNFWEIELEGESFTTRSGRIGTDGEEETHDFESSAEARKAHDTLVAENENKGYRLVGSAEKDARPLTQKVPSNPALEDAIRAKPDDAHTWQVYADWLQEQGEGWGEVIGAAARGKPDGTKQDGALGSMLEPMLGGSDAADAVWKYGVLDEFRFEPDEHDDEYPMDVVLERVLKHPAGHFVRKLSLGLPPHEDLEWHMEGLAEAVNKAGPLPFLEELDLSVPSEHMDQESWRRVGDVRGIWEACPSLKVLKLRGSAGSDDGPKIKLAPIVAPKLETLIIYSGGLDEAAPVEIGEADFPSLRHLELLFGRDDYGCTSTVGSLAGILAGTGLPKLEYLGLKNSEWEGELIEAIAKSAIVKRLKVLDLSMGILWRDGAAALVKYAGALEHLEHLILDDNFFDEAQAGFIKAALPNAQLGEQKALDEPEEDPWRYTSIGE